MAKSNEKKIKSGLPRRIDWRFNGTSLRASRLLQQEPLPSAHRLERLGIDPSKVPVGNFESPVHWEHPDTKRVINYRNSKSPEGAASQGMLFPPTTVADLRIPHNSFGGFYSGFDTRNLTPEASDRLNAIRGSHYDRNFYKNPMSRGAESLIEQPLNESRMSNDLIRELGGNVRMEKNEKRTGGTYYNSSNTVTLNPRGNAHKRYQGTSEVLLHELGHRAERTSLGSTTRDRLIHGDNSTAFFGSAEDPNKLNATQFRTEGVRIIGEAIADGLSLRYHPNTYGNRVPSTSYYQYSAKNAHPVDKAIYLGVASHAKRTGEILNEDNDRSLKPSLQTLTERGMDNQYGTKAKFLHKLLQRSPHARNVLDKFTPAQRAEVDKAVDTWKQANRTSSQPPLPFAELTDSDRESLTVHGYDFPADHYPDEEQPSRTSNLGDQFK